MSEYTVWRQKLAIEFYESALGRQLLDSIWQLFLLFSEIMNITVIVKLKFDAFLLIAS